MAKKKDVPTSFGTLTIKCLDRVLTHKEVGEILDLAKRLKFKKVETNVKM